MKYIKKLDRIPKEGLCSCCGRHGQVRGFRLADDMEPQTICDACLDKVFEQSMFLALDPNDFPDEDPNKDQGA
ncbi:MAG: hypothetical protein HYY81_07060 [Deltaproteobacteria bacterium]|nr:hypothetical protein [Deltaproteobacteria bacterium]